MQIQCGWCNRPMGQKPPLEDKSVTTTICPACLQKKTLELEHSNMEQALSKLTERHR